MQELFIHTRGHYLPKLLFTEAIAEVVATYKVEYLWLGSHLEN